MRENMAITVYEKWKGCFICYDISKCEWDTWLRLFNGQWLIHCFKGVSKTKILWVKDKHSDTFRSLICLSGEITAYLFRIRPHANLYATNVAPRQFCMLHLDFFSKNVKNRGLGRTLTCDALLLINIKFSLNIGWHQLKVFVCYMFTDTCFIVIVYLNLK